MAPMIDLHTHSIFSDGELLPSELIRRAHVKGYTAIAITDHVDFTNIEHALSSIFKVKYLEEVWNMRILAGVELTHVPPQKIERLALMARRLGAEIIVVHGETPVEPVAPGTDRAAVEIGVDILAHPGFITQEEAEIAAQNNVCLEITSRSGHNITNGHVARIASQVGAEMVVDTDTHSPDDLIDSNRAMEIAMGAGLTRIVSERMIYDHPIIKEKA